MHLSIVYPVGGSNLVWIGSTHRHFWNRLFGKVILDIILNTSNIDRGLRVFISSGDSEAGERMLLIYPLMTLRNRSKSPMKDPT